MVPISNISSSSQETQLIQLIMFRRVVTTAARMPAAVTKSTLSKTPPPFAVVNPSVMQAVRHVPAQLVTIRSFGSESFLDAGDVMERVMMVVSNFEKVDTSKVSKESKFKEDLDLDSLDAVEVVMAIEEEFAIEIPDAESDKILSVADAVEYISSHPLAK